MPPKKRTAVSKQKAVKEDEVARKKEPEVENSEEVMEHKATVQKGKRNVKEKAIKIQPEDAREEKPEPEVENSDEVLVHKVTVQRGKRNVKEKAEIEDGKEEVKKTKRTGKTKDTQNGDDQNTQPAKINAKSKNTENGDDQESKRAKKRGKTPIETENTEEDDQETIPAKKTAKTKNLKKTENGDDQASKRQKRGKTPIETENMEEEPAEEPVARQKRGKKAKEMPEEDDDADEDVEPPKKVGRKKPERKESKPKNTKKEDEKPSDSVSNTGDGKNKTTTNWGTINFSCNKANAEGNMANFKITSWNVDGLRAWLKKDGMGILSHDSPDILCLQETKCSDDDLPNEIVNVEGYRSYWCASDKKGYAGVGLMTKKEPIQVLYGIEDDEQDAEGRCITAEFEHFFLITVYVPNAGRKLATLNKRLDWNAKFKDFIKKLDEKKPVIVCGDMNVAHNEIDLKNPKTNKKNAGFTQEERDGMTDFLESGFADTFRSLYPEKEDVYTFWTYMANSRKKNVGWRIDYFLVSNRFKSKVCDNVVLDQIFGSDHCPITLFINI